jgi:hypothetical protein
MSGNCGVDYQTGLYCFVGLAWALWTTRNKIYIQKIFPDKPLETVHLALSLVQKWKILLKEATRTKVETMVGSMLEFIREFHLLDSNPSNVGVIWSLCGAFWKVIWSIIAVDIG